MYYEDETDFGNKEKLSYSIIDHEGMTEISPELARAWCNYRGVLDATHQASVLLKDRMPRAAYQTVFEGLTMVIEKAQEKLVSNGAVIENRVREKTHLERLLGISTDLQKEEVVH